MASAIARTNRTRRIRIIARAERKLCAKRARQPEAANERNGRRQAKRRSHVDDPFTPLSPVPFFAAGCAWLRFHQYPPPIHRRRESTATMTMTTTTAKRTTTMGTNNSREKARWLRIKRLCRGNVCHMPGC